MNLQSIAVRSQSVIDAGQPVEDASCECTRGDPGGDNDAADADDCNGRVGKAKLAHDDMRFFVLDAQDGLGRVSRLHNLCRPARRSRMPTAQNTNHLATKYEPAA